MTLVRTTIAGAFTVLAAASAHAQTVMEQGIEHRFQIDFVVNDAALQRMLPQGWVPNIATMGPAKDCNLRMIFIDRMDIVGVDGKAKGKGAQRMVYLAIPVKQTVGGAMGQMIIGGLTEDAADVPGAFGVYQRATTATMTRSVTASGASIESTEDWQFVAASGERMEMHIKYERAPTPAKGGGEVRFYDPKDPSKYQIFRTEQGIDILRNATTNPPDRVKEFSYKAGGRRIATLFDGTEKIVSWDSYPWYNRTVLTP